MRKLKEGFKRSNEIYRKVEMRGCRGGKNDGTAKVDKKILRSRDEKRKNQSP